MRKFALLAIISLLFTLFALPISAAEPRVIDNADLLTSSEEAILEESIAEIADEYTFDIVIVYVDDIGNRSPRSYADDFFDYNGYGYGSSRDGILLLVSLDRQDWQVSTSGSGEDYFRDAALDHIEDEVIPYLSDGDYYSAAQRFISLTESVISGDFAESRSDGFPFVAELIILALSLILAFAIAFAVKRSMNTARKQTGASRYADPQGVDLSLARDTYLYSTVTKVKIETNSSGSHRSSSGRSHGGRGGKF